MFNKKLYDRLMEVLLGCGLPVEVLLGTLRAVLDELKHNPPDRPAA